MDFVLGKDCKVYCGAAGTQLSGLAELSTVRKAGLSAEAGEADVTTRANDGWRATVGTLKDGSIEFEMVWDTEDAGFSALQSAYFDDTSVELAVMDGDIEEAGSQGLRASFVVTNFTRNEPLEEAMTVSVTLKIAYSDNAPQWMTVGGS